MRVALVEERGGAEVLRVVERPLPEPGRGQVLIKTQVAGVNWADIMQRTGDYPTVLPLPYVPGHEVAGAIEAVGAGVTDFAPGERVAALVLQGGYAEYALASVQLVVRVPAQLDMAAATALIVQGLTAQLLVQQLVQKGDRVLVTAAAGGVGSLALQLAKLAGAQSVVGAAGSADKCRVIAELGALAVDYAQPDWAALARGHAGPSGFDCVLDAVGGQVREAAYALLAAFGRMGIYGNAAEGVESWNAARWHALLMANQSVHGYSITNWLGSRPTFMHEAYAQLVELVRRDALRVQLHPAYELHQVAQAHRDLAARRTVGKVVLRISARHAVGMDAR